MGTIHSDYENLILKNNLSYLIFCVCLYVFVYMCMCVHTRMHGHVGTCPCMKVAMQERKTQETLREKAFDAFVREENRAESKVIDELTSYTYGQKQEV